MTPKMPKGIAVLSFSVGLLSFIHSPVARALAEVSSAESDSVVKLLGGRGGGGGGGGGNPGRGGGGGNPGQGGGGNPGRGGGGGNPGQGGGGGNPGRGGGGGNPGQGGGGNPGRGGGGGNPGQGGGGNPGHGGGGNPGHGGGNGPGYGGGNPGHGGGNGPGYGGGNPGHGGYRPHPVDRDGRGNIVRRDHGDRMRDSDERMRRMRRDSDFNRWVSDESRRYRDGHWDEFRRRADRHNDFYRNGRDRYRSWYRFGFYGGFHWEFRPYYDMHDCFSNPMLYWFYAGVWDGRYTSGWYGPDYWNDPYFNTPYRYLGVFYPTEEFRDLNYAMSVRPFWQQSRYREAMTYFVERLASYGYGGMGANDVVVNHFQILPYDDGLVLEGFVATEYWQAPFKAYLDLNSPASTQVFVPRTMGYEPSASEIDELSRLNDRIEASGGLVESDYDN